MRVIIVVATEWELLRDNGRKRVEESIFRDIKVLHYFNGIKRGGERERDRERERMKEKAECAWDLAVSEYRGVRFVARANYALANANWLDSSDRPILLFALLASFIFFPTLNPLCLLEELSLLHPSLRPFVVHSRASRFFIVTVERILDCRSIDPSLYLFIRTLQSRH